MPVAVKVDDEPKGVQSLAELWLSNLAPAARRKNQRLNITLCWRGYSAQARYMYAMQFQFCREILQCASCTSVAAKVPATEEWMMYLSSHMPETE